MPRYAPPKARPLCSRARVLLVVCYTCHAGVLYVRDPPRPTLTLCHTLALSTQSEAPAPLAPRASDASSEGEGIDGRGLEYAEGERAELPEDDGTDGEEDDNVEHESYAEGVDHLLLGLAHVGGLRLGDELV